MGTATINSVVSIKHKTAQCAVLCERGVLF